MKLSHSVKKRFIKDFSLPFQLVQEPYFTYYINTIDKHFNTVKKVQYLQDAVDALGGEAGFFKEADRIKDFIINEIQAYDVYRDLAQNSFYGVFGIENNIQQKNVYTLENVDKTFISIDLKHANFNILKMYSPTLVMGFETYEDLIGSISDYDYFKKSKYMRQVIFGNLLPKKQQRMQSWLMDLVVTVLKEHVAIDIDRFISASADEVVISIDKSEVSETVEKIKEKLQTESEFTKRMFDNFKFDAFELKSIGGRNFFVKESLLGNQIEFKGIPSFLFMQVYKKFIAQPLEDKDLMFYHEGYLSQFKQFVFEGE